MRIAYVCADPGVPVFGSKGASVHVQEMVRAFRRHGAEVVVFATRFGTCGAPEGFEAVPVHPLPEIGRGRAADRERRAMAANRGLTSALAAAGPFDLIYERYSLWSSAGMCHAARAGVPGILEVNAPLVDEQAAHRELVDRAAADRVARRAFTTATAVVTVSSPVARWVRSHGGPGVHVEVVPNGVDPARFTATPGTDAARERNVFTAGFVGTLKPWHGTATLVEAVGLLTQQHPGWRLLVVGDGPGRAALEERIARQGLAHRTELTGAVAPSRIPDLLARMDVAAAPYTADAADYFSPLKLYEYLAAGRPVVASAVGQVTDVIRDHRTGLLVPPGDPVALADALATLRADERLRHRVAAAGRTWVARERTWQAVAQRILELARARRRVPISAARVSAAVAHHPGSG